MHLIQKNMQFKFRSWVTKTRQNFMKLRVSGALGWRIRRDMVYNESGKETRLFALDWLNDWDTGVQPVHVTLQNKKPKTALYRYNNFLAFAHFIVCGCLTGRDQKQLWKICQIYFRVEWLFMYNHNIWIFTFAFSCIRERSLKKKTINVWKNLKYEIMKHTLYIIYCNKVLFSSIHSLWCNTGPWEYGSSFTVYLDFPAIMTLF